MYSSLTLFFERPQNLPSIEERKQRHLEILKYLDESRSAIKDSLERLERKIEDLAALNKELEGHIKGDGNAASGEKH
jgi:predicted  nucleic acid-binding Zn-ribbon protein